VDQGAASSANLPPAWFADPFARHQYRYWSGTEWTSFVADAGVQSVDPPPAVH
jgi:hypothetical protein